MTDTAIISAILSGDNKGYSKLMKRHKSHVFYFVFKMVNNQTDAEDLTMITFEKAFSKLSTWKPEYKFSTWLFTIAKNTVLDFFTMRDKRPNNFDEIDKYKFIADKNYTPEEEFIHAETVKVIEERIDKLPKKRKELIRLHVDGHSDEEIAEITGNTHVGIRTKLSRTREQLKQLLYEKDNPVINYCIA